MRKTTMRKLSRAFLFSYSLLSFFGSGILGVQFLSIVEVSAKERVPDLRETQDSVEQNSSRMDRIEKHLDHSDQLIEENKQEFEKRSNELSEKLAFIYGGGTIGLGILGCLQMFGLITKRQSDLAKE